MTILIAKFLNTVTHFSIDSFVGVEIATLAQSGADRFSGVSGEVAAIGTEADNGSPLNGQIRITRMRARAPNNASDGALTIAFRDDGADVCSVVIPAGNTALQDSGALNVTVAAGSLIGLRWNDPGTNGFNYDQVGFEIQYERALN